MSSMDVAISNMFSLAAAAAANEQGGNGAGFDLAALFKSISSATSSPVVQQQPPTPTSVPNSNNMSASMMASEGNVTASLVVVPSSTATSPHSVDSTATTTTGGSSSPPVAVLVAPSIQQTELRGTRANTAGIPQQYLRAPPPITRDTMTERQPFTPIRPTYAPSGHGRQILIYESRSHPGCRREFAYKTRFTNQSGLTTVYFRCMACRALRHRLQRIWTKEKLPAVPCIAVKNELLINDPDFPEASDHFCAPLSIEQSNERLRQTYDRGNKRARRLEATVGAGADGGSEGGDAAPGALISSTGGATQAKRRQTRAVSRGPLLSSESTPAAGVKCEIIESAPLNLWTIPVESMDVKSDPSLFVQNLFDNNNQNTQNDGTGGLMPSFKTELLPLNDGIVDVVGTADSDSEGSSRGTNELVPPLLKLNRLDDDEDSPKKRLDALLRLDEYRQHDKAINGNQKSVFEDSVKGKSNNPNYYKQQQTSSTVVSTAASAALQQLAVLGAASSEIGNHGTTPSGGLFSNLFNNNGAAVANNNNRKFSVPVMSSSSDEANNNNSFNSHYNTLSSPQMNFGGGRRVNKTTPSKHQQNGGNGNSYGNGGSSSVKSGGSSPDSVLHTIAARLIKGATSTHQTPSSELHKALALKHSPATVQQQQQHHLNGNNSNKLLGHQNPRQKAHQQHQLQNQQQQKNASPTPPTNASLMALMNAATNFGRFNSSPNTNGVQQQFNNGNSITNGRKQSACCARTPPTASNARFDQLLVELLHNFNTNNNHQQQQLVAENNRNGNLLASFQSATFFDEQQNAHDASTAENVAKIELICTLILTMAKAIVPANMLIKQSPLDELAMECCPLSASSNVYGKTLGVLGGGCGDEKTQVGHEAARRMQLAFGMKLVGALNEGKGNFRDSFQKGFYSADYVVALEPFSVIEVLQKCKFGARLILSLNSGLVNEDSLQSIMNSLDDGHLIGVALLVQDELHSDQELCLRTLAQHPCVLVVYNKKSKQSIENGTNKHHKDGHLSPEALMMYSEGSKNEMDESRRHFVDTVATLARVIATLDEGALTSSEKSPKNVVTLHLPTAAFTNGMNKVLAASAIVSLLSAQGLTNSSTSLADAEQSAIVHGIEVDAKLARGNEISFVLRQFSVSGYATPIGTMLASLNGLRLSVPILLSAGNHLAISRRIVSAAGNHHLPSSSDDDKSDEMIVMDQLAPNIVARASLQKDPPTSVAQQFIKTEPCSNYPIPVFIFGSADLTPRFDQDELYKAFFVVQY